MICICIHNGVCVHNRELAKAFDDIIEGQFGGFKNQKWIAVEGLVSSVCRYRETAKQQPTSPTTPFAKSE